MILRIDDEFGVMCTDITKEQAEDIEWLASTTEDTYKPIHELMEGIKKCFDSMDKEHKNENT